MWERVTSGYGLDPKILNKKVVLGMHISGFN